MVGDIRVIHIRNDISMDTEVPKDSVTAYSNSKSLWKVTKGVVEILGHAHALREDIAWQYYQRQKQSHWTADEIDFFQDAADWRKKLSKAQRQYLMNLLACFWDGHSVLHAYLSRGFSQLHSNVALRYFYTHYLGALNVHAEVYMRLLGTICDGEAIERCFDDFEGVHNAAAVGLSRWLDMWGDSTDVGKMLFCLVVGETCWLRAGIRGLKPIEEKGLMPGLHMAHALMERDKGLHLALVASLLRKHLIPIPPKPWRRDCLSDAIQQVKNSVDHSRKDMCGFALPMERGLSDMADVLWALVELRSGDIVAAQPSTLYTTSILDDQSKGAD